VRVQLGRYQAEIAMETDIYEKEKKKFRKKKMKRAS